MLISIIGNISSGKSSLIKRILQLKPGYKVLSIDNYRRKYNKRASIPGEDLAWDMLIDAIREGGDLILEMTGASQNYHRCMAAYPGSVYTILLNRSVDWCYKKAALRKKEGYELPPLPYKYRNFKDSLINIQNKLSLLEYDISVKREQDIKMLLEVI